MPGVSDSLLTSIPDTLLITDPATYGQAYFIIKAWIILVVVLFIALVVRFTFGVGFTEENPNPHLSETFAMPRGVFRGLLTLSLLFIVLLMEILSLRGTVILVGNELFVPEDMFRELMVAFEMMLAFYFGSKVMHHVTSADRDKSKNIAKVAAGRPPEGGGAIDEPGAVG